MTCVAVAPNKFARGVDGSSRVVPESYEVLELSAALTRSYSTDAHLVTYVLPGAQKQPRINKTGLHAVHAMPTVGVFLFDVDNPDHRPWTPELLELAQAEDARLPMLHTTGIYYTAHGRRLVQPIEHALPADRVEPYLRRWLLALENDGIAVDWACRDWTRHFRLPHVRRGGQEYRSPRVDLSRMRAIPLEPLDEVTAPEPVSPKSSSRSPRPALQAWVSDLPPTWAGKVPKIAKVVREVESVWHELFLALAGALLSRGVPPEQVPVLCRAISLATGCDTRTHDRELAARTTVQRWTARHPVQGYRKLRADYPHVADCLDEVLATGAEARARASVRNQGAPEVRPLAETVAALEGALREAKPGVTVIAAECGLGKTRAAIRVAMERSERGLRTAISVDKNSLAIQITKDLRALGATVRRVFGPLSVLREDGTPECTFHALAEPLVAGGQSLRREFCEGRGMHRCPHFDQCQARSGIDGSPEAPIVVGPHAMLHRLADSASDEDLLIVDEPPSLLQSGQVSEGDLRRTTDLLTHFQPAYAETVSPILESLTSWLSSTCTSTELHDVIDESAASRLPDQVVPPLGTSSFALGRGSTEFANLLGQASRTLATVHHALESSRTTNYVRVEGRKGHRTMVVTSFRQDVASAVEQAPTVVWMDAQGASQVPMLAKLCGRAPMVHHFAAADGTRIHRCLIRTSSVTRRSWSQSGRFRVDRTMLLAVRRAVQWALEDGDAKSLALITFRPLKVAISTALSPKEDLHRLEWEAMGQPADALEEARLAVEPIIHAWPGAVHLGHYGAMRGLDAMKEVDALVTIGDPWPNLGQIRQELEWLNLDLNWEQHLHALCQAELEQAHGRIRAVHRKRPARVAHVGVVLPSGTGWSSGVEFRHREPVVPSMACSMTVDELRSALAKLGGVRAAARRLDCSHTALNRYQSGLRGIPADVEERLRGLMAVGGLSASHPTNRVAEPLAAE